MVCFKTKNPNLGKFWRVLQWKMLVFFMDTWSILRSLVIFYGSWNIGIFFPVLVCVRRKIWQPCLRTGNNNVTVELFQHESFLA
jgi:hypothetical protein